MLTPQFSTNSTPSRSTPKSSISFGDYAICPECMFSNIPLSHICKGDWLFAVETGWLFICWINSSKDMVRTEVNIISDVKNAFIFHRLKYACIKGQHPRVSISMSSFNSGVVHWGSHDDASSAFSTVFYHVLANIKVFHTIVTANIRARN